MILSLNAYIKEYADVHFLSLVDGLNLLLYPVDACRQRLVDVNLHRDVFSALVVVPVEYGEITGLHLACGHHAEVKT